MTSKTINTMHAPRLLWLMLETRSVFEYGSFLSLRLLMRHFPKGDGHPVIVYPGFLGAEGSTKPMRGLLEDLGYEVYDWGMGRNTTFNADREAAMHAMLKKVYGKHGKKVSLVGWSLGGVFAREVAKVYPDYVRQVISLGSPILGPNYAARAKSLFEAINGKPSPETQERLDRLHEVPNVPCSSIFSKTDGVVHWQGSLQDTSAQSENIEVPASHIGLGVNPLVMYVLAERLAQSEGAWKPFKLQGLRRLAYKLAK